MYNVVWAFDQSAGSYDGWYALPKGRQVFDTEKRVIEGFLPRNGVGVEVGAGTGIFAEALTNIDRTVVCVDLSKEMLALARQRSMPSILGSAQSLPLRDGCLDFAYMITVAEFLPEPRKAFEESANTVRKGSPLVLLFINRASAWGNLYGEMAEKGDPIFSKARLYFIDEVREMLVDAGLTLEGEAGTLTSGPTEPDAGGDMVPPGVTAGVVVFKAVKPV